MLEFLRRLHRLPGLQAAVHFDDRIACSVAYGVANVEAGIPLDVTHRFRIASQSKMFTACAVLKLIERGLLRFDDTVGSRLMDLRETVLADITVEELLSHGSGLIREGRDGDFWQLSLPFPDAEQVRESLVDRRSAILSRLERFKYSNLGYAVLGMLIEATTGVPFGQAIHDLVIGPLELLNTEVDYRLSEEAGLVVGYSSLAYANARLPMPNVPTNAFAPATGACSTTTDMVTFLSAHYAGDSRLLSQESRRRMRRPWWNVGSDIGKRYGLGLAMIRVGEHWLVGHRGAFPGTITSSWSDTARRIAVSVAANAIDAPADDLAQLAFRLIDLATSQSAVEWKYDLRRFTGRFVSLWGVNDIALLGGRLYLMRPTESDPSSTAVELKPVSQSAVQVVGDDGYGSYGEAIEFSFAQDGSIDFVRGESASTWVPFERFRAGGDNSVLRYILDY